MEEWADTGAADSFNITPTHLPRRCEDVVGLITPELQRRRRFRTTCEGTTLRENLGLKPHVGRYAPPNDAASVID